MELKGLRVYCAGPLFNAKEQEEMLQISEALEEAGFETFLPQRDGLELAKCVDELVREGMARDEAGRLMAEAIFALDVYQVLEGCHLLVANLNGRVPDEGAVSEAAIAWARGKPVIGYKADMRTAFGGQDNPLVTGLFGFGLVSDVQSLVTEAVAVSRRPMLDWVVGREREQEIAAHLALGEQICAALHAGDKAKTVADVMMRYHQKIETITA